MNEQPAIWLAYEWPTTVDKVEAAMAGTALTLEQALPLDELPADLSGCHMLVVDQTLRPSPATLRIYSICEANPETLVIVLVKAPRTPINEELLRAGAFAVIEDAASLSADLLQASAAARRLQTIQEKHKQMSANLAHQDKIAAIGVLAAGVSHEVNNPCAAVLSNVASLREGLEDIMRKPRAQRLQALDAFASEAIEALTDCIGASHRIADIVTTLNLFSRKDAHLEAVSVDVNAEVQTVLRLLGREVKYQAAFEVDLAQPLPAVVGPRNSVAQVLTNLVVNALDATAGMPKHERRIWIKTLCDADYVVLEVGDNGPGISPELAPRVFDPFFTTKPHGEGTGLGLAITRQLVQQMNGEILVHSAPGEGATFNVFFERPKAITSSGAALACVPPSSERLRVLVVDDDPYFPAALARVLGRQFELKTARSAADAKALLAKDAAFDALLTDVIMPDTDGVSFFLWLSRQHPQLRTRVMFLTGGITSRALSEALDATNRPCLTKPINHQELVGLIRALVREENALQKEMPPVGHRTMG